MFIIHWCFYTNILNKFLDLNKTTGPMPLKFVLCERQIIRHQMNLEIAFPSFDMTVMNLLKQTALRSALT